MDNVVNFNDQKVYNAEMVKSAYDKLGFVDQIFDPLSIIVDFGCADGAITRMIKSFYPDSIVVGYDLPQVLTSNHLPMIDPVDVVIPTDQNFWLNYIEINYKKEVFYTSSLTVIKFLLEQFPINKSLLVINSVTHEIYNYMSRVDRRELFNDLFSMQFSYIWVRDMYINAPDHSPVFESILKSDTIPKDRLQEFIAENGDLTLETLVQFLLKFRYKNWDKELLEDYNAFCENINEFENLLYYKGYTLIRSINYVLPYVNYINLKDGIVDLENNNITTHTKRLYKFD